VSIGYELNNVFVNIRFMAQGKKPTVMSKIVNYHKIKFVTRNTQNWRSPNITMEEFKWC
jgi:hypothetical protein